MDSSLCNRRLGFYIYDAKQIKRDIKLLSFKITQIDTFQKYIITLAIPPLLS